ncbi:MAG: cysteine hydrolase family protein [Thermomicrobiales bacterium]
MAGRTGLVVIDLQAAMLAEEPPAHRREEMLAAVGDLLAKARAAEAPVVFIRHHEEGYEQMQPGHPGFEVHRAVAPLERETIIDKRTADAFCETPLQKTLDALGVETIVVAGMQTQLCVDTTCRSALHRDYDVVLVGDGHSTWDTPDLSAAQIVAHVNATLAGMPHPRRKIVVRPASEVTFGS